MTLSPVDDRSVVGAPGPDYRVGPYCANPTCNRLAEHAHHLFRRSKANKPWTWVSIEGQVWGNLVGLCPDCHALVTGDIGGHKAAIRLVNDEWWWCRVLHLSQNRLGYERIGTLDPQPPTPVSLASRATGPDTESDACPTCGHRRRRSAGGAGRRRKSWTIKVPADDEEDGATVLDALVDDLAPMLGVEANTTGRYYVIVPALVYAHQDARRFLDSIKGVGS